LIAKLLRFWETPSGGDADARTQQRVLFGIVRSIFVIFLLLSAVLWIPGTSRKPGVASAVIVAGILPLLAAIALARRGRLAVAGRLTVVTLTVGAMGAVACFGGLDGPVAYTLPLCVAVAGLLHGRRTAGVVAVATLGFMLVLLWLERQGLAPFVASILSTPAVLLSTAAGIGVAFRLISIYTGEVELARREAAASTQRAVASEHELADLVRFSPDGIALLDADGRVELANESMASIAGQTAAQLRGVGLADLPGMGSEGARQAVLEGLARLHERGEALWEQALEVRGRGVPVEVHARFLVRHDGARRVQLVVRDLSFRAEAEQARDRLEGELREARRLEGLGRLAGGIAHDFRNLLVPIMVNGQLLEEGGALGAEDRELAREIGFAAQRANGLTQQLLAFARRQVMELRALDLNTVVRELEPILRRLVREDVAVHLALAGDLGTLNGDQVQLEQVLVNLVANARDAMPTGGSIRVETANVTVSPEEAARLPGRRAGRHVALTVADTGVGMSDEVRRHVFEPFFTTKASGQGTGLGLATVHGIVAQCGGTIEVESAVGRGTLFRILFPRLDAAAAQPAAGLPAAQTAARPSRVLVVDDDDLVRSAVARTLRSAGHAVTEARGAEEALALSRTADEPFDLLVTDVVMPRIAGPELASAFRVAPRQRVLFMSGYTDDGAILRGTLAEGTAFIAKPFTREDLLAKAAALLAS
jgi:two-component system cell cycle sensor histidine kinase/response regulator CckA